MTTMQVGTKLVELCSAGKLDEVTKTLYGEDIVSVEAGGPEPEAKGLASVIEKGKQWAAVHEIHSTRVEGPFPNGDRFAVVFHFDLTHKPSGKRIAMNEVALYTVKNDKIVREEFFYPTGP